ncbi:MAG TPA: Uma2 family endonuclease [Polyangiaceae bacterium]
MTTPGTRTDSFEYVRPPMPLYFPESELVPESKRHLEQRTALYQILKLAFGERAAVGSEQFVYWDPTDPRQCLAPDVFVRLDSHNDVFRIWKAWERGAPDVAVEILSRSDEPDPDWEEKLERYRRLGVQELVCFDPRAGRSSLRVWAAHDGDLVERVVRDSAAESRCLPGTWLVVGDPALGDVLRLARGPEASELFPTPEEREAQRAETERRRAETERRRAEAERQRAEAERQRADQEHRQRTLAEARIRELEAELRRRDSE